MAEIGSAFLSILPSAKGFGSKLESDVGRETNGVGKKIGSGFGTAIKGGAVAALGGAFVAASFLKSSLGEAREAQKIGAATNAIIKATGGAANLTAEQVGNLSGALSNKIGVDDEIIQSGANILLTFKAVRDEVGKGNDVFTRATAAGADLAAAGFGSIESNAKTLGKALNDPLKGITALTRSGVTFTEQQKEQIKTLVASGDTLKAQKIILGEVEKQVGGVAAASATSGEKATVAFGNLKEQIGTALLPIVDKLATVFVDKIVPAVSAFVSEMQNGTGAGGTFVQLVKNIFSALKPVGAFIFGTLVPAIAGFVGGMVNGTGAGGGFVGFLKGIYNAVKPVGEFIAGTVVPAIKNFVAGMATGTGSGGSFVAFLTRLKTFVTDQLVPAVQGVVDAIRNFIDKALPIAQAFVEGMQTRLAPLVPKIQSIFATIGAIIVGALNAIKVVIETVLTVVQFIWQNFGTTIMNFVAGAFSAIATIIGGALNIIKGIIQVFTSLLTGDWSGLWDGIKLIVSGAWDVIKGIVSGAVAVIKAVLAAAWTVIKAGVSAAWDGIKAAISGAINAAKDAVQSQVNAIKSVVTGVWNAIKSATSSVWDGVKSAITSAINTAKDVVKRAIDGIKDAFDGLRELVGKVREVFGNIVSAIENKITDAIGFVKVLPARAVNALSGAGTALLEAGKNLIQGFINGIKERGASVVGAVTAPLRAGIAAAKSVLSIFSPSRVFKQMGVYVMQGFEEGVIKGSPKAVAAIIEGMKKVVDAAKEKRDELRGVLDGLKSDFASLSSSIASTFTGNLFEGATSSDFLNNLASKSNDLFKLKAAFKKLLGYGISPQFLSQLFQSGNLPLILDLANGKKSTAVAAADIFSDTQSLADSLGNKVARADLGPKLDKTNDQLERLNNKVERLAKELAREINAAATAGKKGRVAA